MKSTVRTLASLGAELVLAPERWVAMESAGEGIPLEELVVERRERAEKATITIDTTHAREGILELRGGTSGKSAKKLAHPGDLVVSRLRPYLRQIALVPPHVDGELALSTEFYVLASKDGQSLAFLLPFLLSPRVQAMLAAAQEGGHHPRVPRDSLFALRVPAAVVGDRERISTAIEAALARWYAADDAYRALIGPRDKSD